MGHASRRKKERRNDGADFEQFIERIERILAPLGAVVERNARITDIDTGEPRDIDVWITTKSGDREIRTMVECRDHERPQHVMWIEQLMGKRVSVGADVVLAVTRKPISEPARVKAQKRDIELRCLRDLSEVEILGLVATGVLGVSMAVTDINMIADCDHGHPTTLTLTFTDGDPDRMEEAPPEIVKLLSHDVMRSHFLFDQAGRGLNIERILMVARMKGWDPTRGAPPERDVDSTVKMTFPLPLFAPTAGNGRRQVSAVEIGYRAHRRLENFDVTRHAYYGSARETKVVAGSWTAPDQRNEFRVTLAVDHDGIRGEVEAVPRTPDARSLVPDTATPSVGSPPSVASSETPS